MAEKTDAPIDRRKDIVFDDPSLLGAETDMYESLLSAKFSSGMDLATQVTLQVIDPDWEMTKNNYFQITRDVYVRTTIDSHATETVNSSSATVLGQSNWVRLEIAAAAVSQGKGSSPVWTLECRNKAIQQMRRDKNPSSITGSGQNWVINAAEKYEMSCLAENTSKNRKINKASNDRAADSTWDVIKSLASEAKFVTFETQGFLMFASQKYMLGLWGSGRAENVPSDVIFRSGASEKSAYNAVRMSWPPSPKDPFQLLSMPDVRRSDNDPLAVQGSATLDRSSGVTLRPGMTIYLSGIPTFDAMYLISQVDYDLLQSGPVRIQFRSPEREEKDIKNYQVGATARQVFQGRGY